MLHHSILFRTLAVNLCSAIALCASANLFAAQFVVTKTTDSFDGACDSDCSLREAVDAANQVPGENIIKLQPLTYVYSIPAPRGEEGETFEEDDISIGDIEVRNSLIISGHNGGATVINADFKDRHFSVASGVKLTLNNIKLTGGRCSTYGGSIINRGTLNLKNILFERNFSSAPFNGGGGGAIANYNELHIQRSTFKGNLSSFGDSGSATGGAIFNQGSAYIRDTAFRDNRATTDDVVSTGGAIFNSGQMEIVRSIFIGNSAQGGGMALYNRGIMSVSNSTFSDNSGEDIYYFGAVQNTASGTLTLIHATIVNSIYGSGLLNYGTANIRNSIILNNKVEWDPNDFSYQVSRNCTNYAPSSQFKTRGLLLGTGNSQCTGEIYVDDQITFTEVLAPLAANGYALESHALLPDSLALDAAIGACSAHDQRWQPRPVDGNSDGVALCDLGAFELQTTD
jgi:CSLREA domain-containing protein